MAHAIDYSTDHTHVDGVDTATYNKPDGTEVTTSAKVKRLGAVGTSVFAGTVFGIEVTDERFAFWNVNLGSDVPESGGSITVGSDIWNIVHVPLARGDDAQWEVIARKES